MTQQSIRIGTRGSLLALWQANWVKSLLEKHHREITVTLEIIKTRGDKILDVPLAKVGGKGLFVKELEEAMLDGRIDLAVHSMKDVPAEFPQGLGIGPILEREDPRDALLSVNHASLEELPQGARVGSSSLRRRSQILAMRSDLDVLMLRGNVNTRIDKLKAGEYDAILLAAAGVKRLEMTQWVREYLDPNIFIPAVGQGAVGIELRLDDDRVANLLAPLNHQETARRVTAERSLLATLEGGCQVPIAAYATLDDATDKPLDQRTMTLHARVGEPEGNRLLTHQAQAPVGEALTLGQQVANVLLDQGAREILANLEPINPTG